MSLFDALTTAVGGLSAQEQFIGNISDDIANSSTVGFKAINTSFESLVVNEGSFSQGGGVLAQNVYSNDVSGSLVASQESTSLAVNGNGFFVVKGTPSSTSATTGADTFNAQDFYTRRGDFSVNKSGYLVNGAGYYLEGYATGSTTLGPIQIPQSESVPAATTLTTLAANLPSNYPLATIVNSAGKTVPNPAYTAPAPVTTTIYDAQGNPHTLSIQFQHTAANTWTAAITTPGSTPANTPATLTLNFGTGSTTAPGTLQSISQGGTTLPGGVVSLPLTFGSLSQTVSLNLGTIGGTAGLTEFSGTSVNVTSETQNGYAAGSLTGLSIDNNGNVNVTYTNGPPVTVAQVALAQFPATDQLQSLDGSTFEQTAASGSANVGAVGTNGAGTISPSELEGSNVNLASELTNLIVAQQAYTANSRVITTANQMLQTLTSAIQG